MKRFIVLIDFSPYSKDQLLLAYHWSIGINAELMLLHKPVILKPTLADPATKNDIVAYDKGEALNRLKDFALENLGNLKNVKFFVSDQDFIFLIPLLLQQGYNDIIFVGLKGTGVLKKIFWGSTTIDLVNNVNHPIVAVPKNLSNFNPDTFYVGINPKYPLNYLQFDYILDFFDLQVKNLLFFSVITKQDDHTETQRYLELLVEKYKSLKNSSYNIYEGENAFKEIKNFMMAQTKGMLLVQRGSRSFIEQISRKFLINELVYDASTPLLILPA